eukprot:maker-scaffold922_size80897-snap-gene-0.19 protein:Tk09254 transcript:maker-scaffold922_size80897-snap-gene-0.19-mRNA-1 annotation:"probable complex i intermediate-associated protein mitochondrial precursor"
MESIPWSKMVLEMREFFLISTLRNRTRLLPDTFKVTSQVSFTIQSSGETSQKSRSQVEQLTSNSEGPRGKVSHTSVDMPNALTLYERHCQQWSHRREFTAQEVKLPVWCLSSVGVRCMLGNGGQRAAGSEWVQMNRWLRPRRLVGPALQPARRVHATPAHWGIRDRFVTESDLNKKPSQLEIQRKGLPENTPTLGERMRRGASSPFFNAHPKDGYYKGQTGTLRDYLEDATLEDVYTKGLKTLKTEIIKWKNELLLDPYSNFILPGGYRPYWQFQTDKDFEDTWITTADSDWGEGYSKCQFDRSPSGKGYFTGELNTRVPKDGRLVKAGYCNLKSVQRYKSFAREANLGFQYFTAIQMRIRGDGRTYILNVHISGMYDMEWNDLWNFPIHTRGGPYWQDIVIPYSKFYLTHKTAFQDDQYRFSADRVRGLSFSVIDNTDGPFALEIDEIGLLNMTEVEENNFDYESYMLREKGFTQKM